MTSYEIVVIVGGIILGYYIVSILLTRTPEHPQHVDTGTNATQNAAQNNTSYETASNNTSLDKDYIAANWHRILGTAESAPHEQIVAAYKQRIGQYHPDKVAQMGVEIRELAEQKSMQINAAYNYAMKLQP